MKIKTFALTMIILMIFTASAHVFTVDSGEPAPSFVLTDMERNYVFSRKIYGKSWLLIDFYATWCVNCNKELPHVEELYNEFSGKGFDVFLMATDKEGIDVVAPFFSERPSPVSVLIDRYQKASKAFGVEALPTMFLVNPDGKIVFKTVGFHEDDIEKLRKILEDNLNE